MVKPATELITSIQTGDADTDDSIYSDVDLQKRTAMLSRVSEMYDINGDGVLDEAERAIRSLDTTGRGYLTNEKVYDLMTE
jgi:hypothetical protein